MIDISFIRSVVEGMKKQRQRPEEGTDELTQEYKELTPGQTNEDTDKDEPGTQGDQAEYQKKRKEIANKFGVESCSALKDEKERKACYAALDAAHVSDDEEEDEDDDPVGKNEEVEYDEKKMKALAKKDKLIGKMMKTTSAKTVFNSEVLGNSSMEKAYQKEEVEVDESTAEYAKSLEKIANDRALKMLSKSERGNLKKIAALLDKEKKEEVEVDEARKAAKDIGLECQECGKRFRSANPRYGVTKCPKCKSTDLDLAYGEEVEEARSREDELKLAKAIAAWKKAGGKVKKLPPGRKFQSLFGKGYKPKKQPRQEEVEIDEGKFKKGDIVIPNMGPHKGEKHKIIHDFGDGSYNITPQSTQDLSNIN